MTHLSRRKHNSEAEKHVKPWGYENSESIIMLQRHITPMVAI